MLPAKNFKMSRARKPIDESTYTGKFAVRLRTMREKKGLSVEEMAERSGIPLRTLYDWESTKASPPVKDLPKLAKALGIKIHALLPKE